MLLREYIRVFLNEARPIPIDKGLVQQLTDDLMQSFIQNLRTTPEEQRSEPVGSISRDIWAHEKIVMSDVHGKDQSIDVVLYANKSSGFGPYVGSGAFGHRKGKPIIIVDLNGKYTPDMYLKSIEGEPENPAYRQLIGSMIYDILIHEITHAVDQKLKRTYDTGGHDGPRSTSDIAKYYNDPKEVRAFMQQISDEVLRGSLNKFIDVFGDNQGIVYALKNSNTWQEVNKHLTPSNKQLIMKAVYREIQDSLDPKEESLDEYETVSPPMQVDLGSHESEDESKPSKGLHSF